MSRTTLKKVEPFASKCPSKEWKWNQHFIINNNVLRGIERLWELMKILSSVSVYMEP